ncbi:MAG: YbaB/EbfC family nucleoid-associated protein [Magnetococcales bacterium]|nr:YbaB/EbfC family nucleoid-associated protein [Magnetococcales bacterium]
MKNLGDILKQAQELQGRMARMQEELGRISVTGQAGGGLVSVTLNGRQEVQKVSIDRKIIDPAEGEMLEDLVAAAFNDAQRKVLEMNQKQLASLTGGLNIPGLGLPGM